MLADELEAFGLTKFLKLNGPYLHSQTVDPWNFSLNLQADPDHINFFMEPIDDLTKMQRVYEYVVTRVPTVTCKNFLSALKSTGNDHIVKFIERKLKDGGVSELQFVQENILQIMEGLTEANKRILELERNPVPIGFIYVQLQGEPDAKVLWPKVKGWEDVTPTYAGLFFRAEGGPSGPFGRTQADHTRHITQMVMTKDTQATNNITLPEGVGGWSSAILVGDNKYFKMGIRFKVNEGEVRPRNAAIRIWKRSC